MIVCWSCGGYVTKIIISSLNFFFYFSSSLQNDDIVIDIDFTDNDRELFAMLEEVILNDSISALPFIVFDTMFDQRNLVFVYKRKKNFIN